VNHIPQLIFAPVKQFWNFPALALRRLRIAYTNLELKQ